VFYLDVAYVAVVIHICCKCIFHLVSVCCNRCCFPRYLTRGQAHATLGAPFTTRHGPSRWSMQPSQRMCMRAVLPPSLALGTRALLSLSLSLSRILGYARYDPSLSHAARVSLVSEHVCCALSLALGYTRYVLSLSHIAGRAHAHALSSRRNIVEGVGCSSSRRRRVFKKSKRRRRAHQVQHTWVSAATCAGVQSRGSVRMSWR
jgi:hypothetical protein